MWVKQRIRSLLTPTYFTFLFCLTKPSPPAGNTLNGTLQRTHTLFYLDPLLSGVDPSCWILKPSGSNILPDISLLENFLPCCGQFHKTFFSVILWWRCIIMRVKVEAPVNEKNLRPTKDLSLLIDSLFILLIWFIQNTQVSFITYGHFQPTPFLSLTNAPSLTPQIHCSLSLSPSPLLNPHSVFTCCNSI